MKKIISVISLIALAIFFSGCGGGGGNDKSDVPESTDSIVSWQLAEVTSPYGAENEISFRLTAKKPAGTDVVLDRFELEGTSCRFSPDEVTYQPSSLSLSSTRAEGTINITISSKENCPDHIFTLYYHRRAEADGKTKEGKYSFTFDIASGYRLVNITSPVYITQPNQNEVISVQLVHGKMPVMSSRLCDTKEDSADGEKKITTDCIIPEALPKEYGRMNLVAYPQSDEGDEDATNGVNENGYVRFEYVGPDQKDMPKSHKEYDWKIHYIDGNGNYVTTGTIKLVFDPLVNFGSVSSLSINYNSTSCVEVDENPTEPHSANVARMIFTVHAVDKNGNPAKAGLTIWPTLINGVNVVNRTGDQATLKPGEHAILEDMGINFYNSDVTTEESMIVIPNAANHRQNYLGHWDISDIMEHHLQLKEAFDGKKSIAPLSYVIGNERRYVEGYGIAVADISKPRLENSTQESPGVDTARYITDENGQMTFEIIYDYVLAGRTFTLAANAYEYDENGKFKRAGTAKVDAFRWPGGYTSSEETVPNDGQRHNVSLTLTINGCNGDPIEALAGRHIVPESIIVDPQNGQCTLDQAASDFTTDHNGQLHLVVSTVGNTTVTKECKISWNASGQGIYLEY